MVSLRTAMSIAPKGMWGLATVGAAGPPGRVRRVVHSGLSILIGLVAWMLAAMIGLMVARGLLYGIVDSGPYDNAWGGPSLAGAWLTHLGISIPIAAAAIGGLVGVTRLYQHLTRWLHGERTARWVMPSSLAVSAAAALFFFAWLQQV